MDDPGPALREAPPQARAAMYRFAETAARDTRRFALGLLLRRRISWSQYRQWCRDARADVRAADRELRHRRAGWNAGRRPSGGWLSRRR